MKHELTKEQKKKKEMIEFLKHILPYWESDDLDDYMYIVHHYDLERVATKIQEKLFQQKQELRSVIEGLIPKYHDTKYHNDAEKVLKEILFLIKE